MSIISRTLPGRYPRGEETKQRIIAAAIEIFGRHGYAGTSTRDIATAAAVNTPALQYYFDGKLGLYKACVEQLTGLVSERIAPAVQQCQAVVDGGGTLDAIVAALGDVQCCLIDSFFADYEGSAIRRLLAWEDAENDGGASDSFMKDRVGLPIFATFQTAIERVAATPMTRTEVEMHALAMMGISIIFHFNQCRAIDMLDWTLDDTLVATLKDVAKRQLRYAMIGLSSAA